MIFTSGYTWTYLTNGVDWRNGNLLYGAFTRHHGYSTIWRIGNGVPDLVAFQVIVQMYFIISRQYMEWDV